MAENHPRPRFHLQIQQTRLLLAGEIKNLLLGKFNVCNILAAQLTYTAVYFSVAEAIILTVVIVEPDG